MLDNSDRGVGVVGVLELHPNQVTRGIQCCKCREKWMSGRPKPREAVHGDCTDFSLRPKWCAQHAKESQTAYDLSRDMVDWE
eukprot:SAG31_NODE_28709_length_406_cov_0.775244_1_plen_81_part_01